MPVLSHVLTAVVALAPATGSSRPAVKTPPPASPSGATPAEPQPEGMPLVVAAPEDHAESLAEMLQLRLPGRRIAARRPGDAWPSDPFALVEVSLEGAAQGRVEVTLSDGRAYYRSVELLEGQATRTLAGAVANLVAAIDEDRIEPDATDVEIALEEVDEAPVEDVPEPAPLAVTPAVAPVPPPEAPVPRWTLGGDLAGLVGLSLGPPRPPTPLFGGGGELAFAGRTPVGGLLRGAVRVASGAHAHVRTTRIRVALGGGYAYRRGRFELAADVAATIEPLVIGAATRVGTRRRAPRPLFGGVIGMQPSFFVTRPHRTGLRWRVFGRIEVAGSAEASGTPGVVRILDDDGAGGLTTVSRAGGLETTLGVGIGLWFDPATKKDR